MIVTWSRGKADDNMPEEILVELGDRIARHPWFQARARLASRLLASLGVHPPAEILEAGCGWGLNLAALEESGYRAAGLDVSRRSLERLERPGRRLIEADLTQPLPPARESFDAVLALDVIEHLDDDRAAVRRLAELVRPGGAVVISVPALPELYSEFDAVQGHRRRYLPETLRDAFASSGLGIERLLWWGSFLVPVLRRQRGRTRGRAGEAAEITYGRYLNLPPWPAPLALRLALAVESRRTLRGQSTTGSSLIALARRPAG